MGPVKQNSKSDTSRSVSLPVTVSSSSSSSYNKDQYSTRISNPQGQDSSLSGRSSQITSRNPIISRSGFSTKSSVIPSSISNNSRENNFNSDPQKTKSTSSNSNISQSASQNFEVTPRFVLDLFEMDQGRKSPNDFFKNHINVFKTVYGFTSQNNIDIQTLKPVQISATVISLLKLQNKLNVSNFKAQEILRG